MTPEEICDIYHDMVDLAVERITNAKSSWRSYIDAKGLVSLRVEGDTATLYWVDDDYESACEQEKSFPSFVLTLSDAEFDAADKAKHAEEEAEEEQKREKGNIRYRLEQEGAEWVAFQELQRKFADAGKPPDEAIQAYAEKKRREEEQSRFYQNVLTRMNAAMADLHMQVRKNSVESVEQDQGEGM